MRPVKDRSITIRIDAELERRLEEAAGRDDRPVSQWARRVLVAAVAEIPLKPKMLEAR
jgi:predicted transcriptional regulator